MAPRRRRLRTAPEIPTSSMADIAFLLIIFFLLTAVFTSTRGLEFAFPEEDPDRLDVQPEEAIHIKVVGERQFVVDRRPMSFEELTGYVQGHIEQTPEKPVIIHTEAEVPYFAMVDVLDLLRRIEVSNISIPTQTERERWRALGYFE